MLLSLITGVGVFILAMKILSDSLNQIAGNRMKSLLGKIADNKIIKKQKKRKIKVKNMFIK